MEPDEVPADAVVRELAEETGLVGTCGRLVGCVERRGPDHHFVILDYRVRVPAGQQLVPADDALDAAWVPLGEVSGHDLVEGLAAFLEGHGVIAPR